MRESCQGLLLPGSLEHDGQVSRYGEDYLPHDIKKAVNEIEVGFGMQQTTW